MPYDQLHAYLQEAVQDIRNRLSVANIGSVRFDIEVSGRTMTGEAEIIYCLGEEYSSNMVRGGKLENVIREFIRRNDWQKVNHPLCLPAPKEEHDARPKDGDNTPL